MFARISTAALSAVALAAPALADLIGVSWSGEVWSIDPATGERQLLGGADIHKVNSLAGTHGTNLITHTLQDGLVLLDPYTQEVQPTQIFAGHKVLGLATPKGFEHLVFAVERVDTYAEDASRLWLLDCSQQPPQMALLSELASDDAAMPVVTGLAFAADGRLYGWSSASGLVRIDPLSGMCTDVDGSLFDPNCINALAFTPDGGLFGAGDGLYRIDHETGAVEPVADGKHVGHDKHGWDLRGIEFVR